MLFKHILNNILSFNIKVMRSLCVSCCIYVSQNLSLAKDLGEYRCFIDDTNGVSRNDEAVPLFLTLWGK